MRLIKLMLAASVAVCAFASCNKHETTPVNNRLKTVEISLENIVMTKALAGDKINSGDAVVVNDIKLFLTDAAGNEYEAYDAAGTVKSQTYFTTIDDVNKAEFHYVDPNCSKVVAVANLGKDITFAEYKAGLADLLIADQQEAKSLVLYDEAALVSTGEEHNDVNADGTTYLSPVYEAELTLTPRVSRFEVDGFSVKFSETPLFEEIKITQLAFFNYYDKTTVVEGTEKDLTPSIDFLNQSEVYSWLDNGQTAWYRDSFEVVITPEDNVKDTPEPLAYHMFSCAETPVMLIKLLADGQPAYLYTKGFFKQDGTEVTEFEEGKIYRMSAAGEELGDGNIPFEDTDIDPMDRCLDITVEVINWAVELVYPEF